MNASALAAADGSGKLTASLRAAMASRDAGLLQARLLAGNRRGRPSAPDVTPARRRAPASARISVPAGPCRQICAEEVGEARDALACDGDDEIAGAHAGALRRAAAREAVDDEASLRDRPCTCRATAAAAPRRDRCAARSSRIGSSRSTGTNMLPSTVSSPDFSCSSSEPMPISRPSSSSSAVPLHSGCGGVVNSASSSRYSQKPANSRLAKIRRLERVRAPAVADHDDVVVLRDRVRRPALDDGPARATQRQDETEAGREIVGERVALHEPSRRSRVSQTDAASVIR